MKISEDKEKHKCDKCKHKFKGKDVALVKPSNTFEAMSMMRSIMFVDKEGTIRGSSSMPKEKGDRLLACPKCKQVHLSGFDKA